MDNIEIIKTTVAILQYIVLDNDLKDLYSFIEKNNYTKYFSNKFINKNKVDKDIILNQLNTENISNKQKTLLFIYCHLYYLMYSFPIVDNLNLKKLRIKLEIDEEAVLFIFTPKDIKFLEQYKSKESKLLTVIDPDEQLFYWINAKTNSLYKKGIYFQKKYLKNLNFEEYQHNADYEARKILENTPGISALTKQFFKYGLDRMGKIQYLGSNFKINDTSMDEYTCFTEGCKILDINKTPDLYVEQGFLNASTVGDEETAVILTSGCFSLLNYDELQFVIGHELGHIKSNHVLYHQMASMILNISRYAGAFTLGLNQLLTSPLKMAILDWYRKSEFTSDRAGLLACQNLNSAITCMMKLSGYPIKYYNKINPGDMINQAREFAVYTSSDNLNSTLEKFMLMDDTHPWIVARCSELIRWHDSGDCKKLIELHSK